MNAMSRLPQCDWDGNPTLRPLTGIGFGHISGKGFAPRERREGAEETFIAAQAIWNHAQRIGQRGVVVQAFWTDCCETKHLIFHNGKDCRLLSRGRTVATSYQIAVGAAQSRVAAINAGQENAIEPVRFGRDVVMSEWVDPDQTNRFSKTPEKVRAFRRLDALVLLHKRGTLKREHVAAGFRLRDDYEMSEGARIGGERHEVRSGHHGGPEDSQLAALARFRNAIQALGQRQAAIVVAVVLQNSTVSEWAERRGMSLTRATGYAEAAMDCLVDHYGLGSISVQELERAEEG